MTWRPSPFTGAHRIDPAYTRRYPTQLDWHSGVHEQMDLNGILSLHSIGHGLQWAPGSLAVTTTGFQAGQKARVHVERSVMPAVSRFVRIVRAASPCVVGCSLGGRRIRCDLQGGHVGLPST